MLGRLTVGPPALGRPGSGGVGNRPVMAKILLIDDSSDIRLLVRILLEQGGHLVREAEEGEKGLLLAHDERPDLVLTDLALPGLSGWDIVRILKSDPETADIPVVALTAHAMRGDRERAMAIGCDGFIVKPIDDERFESLIRSFLRRPGDGDRASVAEGAEGRAGVVATPEALRPGGPDVGVEAAEPRDGALSERTETRRILVVDDSPGVLDLMRQYLKEAGFEVLTALDGPSALERAEREEVDLVVLDVMLPGIDGYEVTTRLKGRDGPFLPVVLVTAGTLDRERGLEAGADDFLGKPLERVELLVRVRSLLRLRDAVEEARRQAEAFRRLDRSKQRFVATVVHDLRTPLNAMALTLETLRLAPPPPEQLSEDVEMLDRNIRQMDQLLTSLLEYSRAVSDEHPLNPSEFDPRRLTEDAAASLAATAAHQGLDLCVIEEADLPEVVVSDYSKCRQVLFNLVSNALKYTREGGITIRARAAGEGCWAIDVADTGVGIAPEDIERIFEEFEQARSGRPAEAPGTGLGLAICRGLMGRLGGRLEVRSEFGRGSTFTATWPVRVGDEPCATPAPSTIG